MDARTAPGCGQIARFARNFGYANRYAKARKTNMNIRKFFKRLLLAVAVSLGVLLLAAGGLVLSWSVPMYTDFFSWRRVTSKDGVYSVEGPVMDFSVDATLTNDFPNMISFLTVPGRTTFIASSTRFPEVKSNGADCTTNLKNLARQMELCFPGRTVYERYDSSGESPALQMSIEQDDGSIFLLKAGYFGNVLILRLSSGPGSDREKVNRFFDSFRIEELPLNRFCGPSHNSM